MLGREFSFSENGTAAGAFMIALLAAFVCAGGASFAHDSWPTSYGEDAAFVKQLMPSVVEFSDDAGDARVLVSPSLQGRVLTCTAAGEDGAGFGWINKELFASKNSDRT